MIQETGMLDVGTHCHYCKQLDFLPFNCAFCHFNFCELHRTQEHHHCTKLIANLNNNNKDNTSSSEAKSNGDKFFQSLLPEKGYIRVKNQQQLPNSTTNSTTSTKRTIKSQLNQSSLDRLLSFFQRHKTPNSKKKSSLRFKSSNSTTSLLQLRKIAVGDDKIPEINRIYVYVHKIDDSNKDNSIEPKPFYINKLWPIGRALDFLAQRVNISNKNIGVDTKDEEKLFIYNCPFGSNNLIELKVNDRVNLNINNLDTLYLIRGKIK